MKKAARSRRLSRSAALLTFSIVISACFDPPIRERLHLDLHADGSAQVTVTVELASRSEKNRNLDRRLEGIRQSLQEGTDSWTRRFEILAADHDTISWQLEQGELRDWGRQARVSEIVKIQEFFAATDIAADVQIGDDYFELALYTGLSTRATRQQRRQVQTALGQWTGALADYFALSAELFAYLEEHPNRAQAILGALYEGALGEEVEASLPETTESEAELLDDVAEAINTAWESIRQVADHAEYSIEELSRLAFDPFPAPLSLEVEQLLPGTQGFATGGKNFLFVPGLSLWSSLEQLEGRWLGHDPLLIQASWYMRTDDPPPLDLEELLGLPRTYARPLPDAAEILTALEEGLEPAPIYSVRWSRSD